MRKDSVLRTNEVGPSGVTSEEEDDEVGEEYTEYAHDVPDPVLESMVQSSLLNPLKSTPQVSVTHVHWPEVEQYTKLNDTTVSTVITWRYKGREVAIEGSWDGWKKREYLQQRSNGDMMIMKVLPVGVYLYRFLVDGQRSCAPDLPLESDDEENLCNILDLERHVLEREGNVLESESSPLSSYNNEYFILKDLKQKVPELPPFLENTPLNNPQFSDDPQSREKPLPCVLNHLFIGKLPTGQIAPVQLNASVKTMLPFTSRWKICRS